MEVVRGQQKARILLKADGLEGSLKRKYNPNSARPRIFDGAAEAKLIALICSPAPEGFARWSLRLLEDDGQFVRSSSASPHYVSIFISEVERNPHSLAFQFERVVRKLAEIRCPVASGYADPRAL